MNDHLATPCEFRSTNHFDNDGASNYVAQYPSPQTADDIINEFGYYSEDLCKSQQVHLKIGTGPVGKAAFDRHTLWAPDLVYTFFMT